MINNNAINSSISQKQKQQNKDDKNISSKIVLLWKSLKTEKNLLDLINLVNAEIFDSTEIVSLKSLHFNEYSKEDHRLYTTFIIPKKKKGEYRTIDAPNPILKVIQQCLNYIFQQIYIPNKSVVGFVPNRSIADGAKVHISQKFVFNIDLKDFFQSISSGRLYKRLQSNPFGLTPTIASIITDLCCYKNAENKSVLPQGAPTSPTITNFICERLDHKLCKLATAYGLKYTRYADDITFSGMKIIFAENGKFYKSLYNIIEKEEHFTINENKTRLCHKGMRQEVTGLTVNEKVNVSRKYVKQLRAMINNWEKKGYIKAQSIFLDSLAKNKEARTKYIDINKVTIKEVILGKLNFLKMVKGEKDSTYLKLKTRFYKLNSEISVPLKKEQIFHHSPQKMVDFLYQFSRNEDFKWFTHNPAETDDMIFNYEVYITKAKENFKKISKGLNYLTLRNVRNFIFDTENAAKDFNNKDIKFRWKDLSKWCLEHKGKHPNYVLVDDYNFEHYINIFKNTIEFRTDDYRWSFANRVTEFICKEDVINCRQDININFTDEFFSIGNSLHVYVDVRQFFSAIKEIVRWIITNKSKSNEVEVSLEEHDDKYVFSIFHKNSFFSIDDNKLKGQDGDFPKVREMLLNVADWTIETDIKDKSVRVFCLDQNTEYINTESNVNKVKSDNRIEFLNSKVGGVKHLITLYKNI